MYENISEIVAVGLSEFLQSRADNAFVKCSVELSYPFWRLGLGGYGQAKICSHVCEEDQETKGECDLLKVHAGLVDIVSPTI